MHGSHWLIILCAVALGACAGSGGEDAGPGSATANRSAAPAAPQGAPSAAGSVTVSWLAPAANTDGSALTNLRGYRIYYGRGASALDQAVVIDTTGLTRYVIEGLPPATWYFAMTSVNSQGVESARSVVASKQVGG